MRKPLCFESINGIVSARDAKFVSHWPENYVRGPSARRTTLRVIITTFRAKIGFSRVAILPSRDRYYRQFVSRVDVNDARRASACLSVKFHRPRARRSPKFSRNYAAVALIRLVCSFADELTLLENYRHVRFTAIAARSSVYYRRACVRARARNLWILPYEFP